MRTLDPQTPDELDHFNRRALALLAVWISLGLLALLMIPTARGFHEWVGWLPFWLLLAPSSSLLVLQRSRVVQWLRARPAPHARQRRRHAAHARRPPRRSSGSALRASFAALLPH